MKRRRKIITDRATEEWLNSYKRRTKAAYKAMWRYFLEFTGLTGDQILESRKADKEYAWEKKVLEFKNWMINVKKQAESTASTAANVVRGFFGFYRCTLQFRRSETQRIKEAKRKTEDYRFSREDLKRMVDVANLKEKYIVTAGKSFGLRAGDFIALTRGDMEPYLDRKAPISIGEYYTQKEKVKAYPFIDPDAKPIIKLMIENMDREGRTKPTDRILKFKDAIQLTRNLKRLAEKAGLKVGNKVVRFHCLRKFLTDRLASFMSESKWKQIVGKAIPESAYVSSDSLREDYLRTINETCFSKAIPEGDIEAIAKKQALMIIAKNAGYSEKEISTIFRERATTNINEEIKALEDILKEEQTQTNGGSTNDCQRIVGEDELEPYLKQGWRVCAVLPSGRVVISNER